RVLDDRIERRVDLEPRRLEVAGIVLLAELPPDEVEKRGVGRPGPRTIAEHDAELGSGRALGLLGADEPGFREHPDHEVAPLERALGVPPRIVVRRPAHLGDEQRELRKLELAERLAEIEAAREAEAVDRAAAVLAEIDLV